MCVLGLCALIDMEQIPQVLNQVSGQILPAFILLFNGLKELMPAMQNTRMTVMMMKLKMMMKQVRDLQPSESQS